MTFCAVCETYLAPGTAFCPNCGASRPQTVPIALLWSAELGEPSANPPMVAGDLLLVATQEATPPARHSTLHALSLADGSLRWQRSFEYALVSGLANAQTSEDSQASEILALVSTTSTDLIRGEGALVALGAAGEERWRWSPGVQRVSAPAVVGSLACVIVDARTMSILDPASGMERVRAELETSASLSAPALAGDVAYVPCRGPHLLAVGLDGQTRWRFDAKEPPDAWLDRTPVVVGEQVFAALTTGAVLALRTADGQLAWRTSVGPAGKPLSVPATDGERLFVGARDGLHALDLTDGREVWAFSTSRRITAAPATSRDVVFATCHDHHVYALDAATGEELWRYEVERRIEVSPVLADCGQPTRPCILVIDRSGTVTVATHPLSAEGYEAAGHLAEAASAYAGRGQVARGAELLETHGESFKAAEMWKAAGDPERAAAQYEAAGAWRQAADLWSSAGHPLRQAEALEAYARSLELEETRSDEECAAAWKAAAQAFDAEGETERAKTCQREVARCLRQPIITLDIEHEGLVLNAWSCLQFTMRNEGYGPARNIVIRASGDEFEGQVMSTREIYTLRAGRDRTERLDVRPLEYGNTVPLRVRLDYMDHAGEIHSCAHTIYIAVASSAIARRKGETIRLFSTSNLQTQLAEARKNLLLIRERKSQYVMDTDIPLQLIKRERDLIQEIAELETRLAQSGDATARAGGPGDQ